MKELIIPIKKKHVLEKNFTTDWFNGLKAKGFYVDKISDASIGTKKVDSYIISGKGFYVCEIKLIDNIVFNLNRLRPNQWASLRKADDLQPGCAIICVYSKKQNKYKIIPFSFIKDLTPNDKVKLTFK